MKKARTRKINFSPVGPAAQIWTVVTIAQDRLSCSIHSSERAAYGEAVSRFEVAEFGAAQKDPMLRTLLAAAHDRNEYERVRKYIELNSRRMNVMQLAEHTVSDSPHIN